MTIKKSPDIEGSGTKGAIRLLHKHHIYGASPVVEIIELCFIGASAPTSMASIPVPATNLAPSSTGLAPAHLVAVFIFATPCTKPFR